MKKLIIFALSLFVVFVPAVLTPTVSYACEDTGDCDVWVNWTGQVYGSKEDCESDPSSSISGGCEGVGGSVGDGWDDEEDSGGDAEGYFYCCGTNMGEFTSLSSCNDECSDGWCGQGASWEEVCDDPNPTPDTSDPCAAEEVVDQNDCLGLTVYDEYGWAYSCTTGDEGSGRCATDTCEECGGHDFEINCDYLRNFVVGVNLGTIYVDTSDCGEYSPSFLKVCESDDTECQNHMQINACAYSSIIRGMWGGEDIDTTLNLTDVNMYANENYGSSCYVPIAGLLGDIECSDNYANVVIDAWWGGYYEGEYSNNSERRDAFCQEDAYYSCDGDSDCEDYVSENESEHCKKILAALDNEYNTNGGDEEAAASTVRNYISDYMANNCPTNDEACSYLKAAFDYYNTDSCASPCEDGENGALSDVCSQFGASGTAAYNKCIKALNGTSTCNAIVNYVDIDCGGEYFNNFDAQDLLAANGMSCYFDTTRTDGYNCVLLAGFLNSYYYSEMGDNGNGTITCSANDETNETECYGDFSKYPSDTQKYLNKALQDAVDSGRVNTYMNVVDSFWDEIDGNELQDRDRMSYWLDKAANELGISCKPLCNNYEHLFNEIDGRGYTDAACNHRNFSEAYSDPLTISRVLLNCEDYNELYNGDWYDENNIATYLGCYNGERIDDVADDNCEFADVWYNYITKLGSDEDTGDYYCNLDEICGDAYQPDTADYYRCKYNLNFTVYPGVNYEFEERCMNYWYDDMREDDSTTLQNFRNNIGLTCADSCGEGQYNRRGQCYDCELPAPKYEDFVNWTAGSTNCAHTYDTIENAGLKIYDLKCELADDFKNWDCTYNALECGGGYYDASGTQFQDGNYADYSCNGDGFDGLGRPLCVGSSWDQTDCADYDEDGDCLVGLDFYYPYDLENECNGSDWSDELDMYVYSCENTISARAIDMLRCDTPVPMGYYGLTNFSQEGWNGKSTKQACSVGDYQDEAGKTSCKDCPAYGVKSTTKATVYGTTESTASTDITACKIPSSYSFKGGHGTYKFNPSCSYSK